MKVKVKAKINFLDMESNVNRKIGEEFICDDFRANYLKEHNAVEILEEIKNEVKVENKETEEVIETITTSVGTFGYGPVEVKETKLKQNKKKKNKK